MKKAITFDSCPFCRSPAVVRKIQYPDALDHQITPSADNQLIRVTTVLTADGELCTYTYRVTEYSPECSNPMCTLYDRHKWYKSIRQAAAAWNRRKTK